MATELPPPPEIPIATTSNTAVIPPVEELETTTGAASLPPAPKRQRRPSVRLGEIGDQSAILSYDSHHHPHQVRRSKPPWRLSNRESKSVKARSLTNLVNGNDSYESNKDLGQNGDVNKKKSKRAKRVRSNWISSSSKLVYEDDISRDEEEGFRDFDQYSEQQSPLIHSNDDDNNNNITWHNRTGRVRVAENEEIMCSRSEGVRTWLIELGLSRYAPVFEVHEVDDEVLPLLTLEDLKDMGINAVGSRRKLYSAIQKLRKGFS